ncbi:MAG: O-antigen ligase family protein [Chthoniobacterales bacterium]
METTPEQTRRSARKTSGLDRRWALAAVAVPLVAVCLGGATEKWAEGIVLVLVGLLVFVRPPRSSFGPILDLLALVLLLLASTAFLPARWFFETAWRAALVNDFSVTLPTTLSPQPWVSLQCLLSLLGAVVWLYYLSGLRTEPRDMRSQMRLFAFGVIGLALLFIALHAAHIAPRFWHNERTFGPFPNRNQTADFLALGGIVVLACASDDIRNRSYRAIVWIAGFVVVIGAIVINYSRAGILLLVGGSGVWLGLLALRKGSAARFAVGISVLLALVAVLLLFGGETLERFHLRGTGTGMSKDFRWLIFRDAFDLIRASPWCGIGLGNFEPIFAIFRNAAFGDARARHPESDWIWLWSELGWVAVCTVVVAAVILLWRAFPRREVRNFRFYLAGAVAALLFALHGVFDVSAHRIGTAFSALFLLGAVFPRPLDRSSPVIAFIARLLALGLVAVGATWTYSACHQQPFPGSLGAEILRQEAIVANRNRNVDEAALLASRALEWTPLDWQLYFVRAVATANQGKIEPALDDFRRARFLEPNAYEVPLEEGKVWAAIAPRLALMAWREALRRAGPDRAEAYAQMFRHAEHANPNLISALEALSHAHRELVLIYLSRLRDEPFNRAISELLKRDPDLSTLNADQRTQLITLWSERGDLEKLSTIVEQHPDWLAAASTGLAKYKADHHDYRGATELVLRFGRRPTLPHLSTAGNASELQKTIASDPTNYAAGYALYRNYREEHRVDDALDVLRHFTALPRPPAYFYFLEAECWGERGDWERAWTAYQKFETAFRR